MDHHHAHHTSGHEEDGDRHRRVLDLDAVVFGAQLGEALDLADLRSPRRIVDLGAGSGTGSRLLRARHPQALLTCIDQDPAMVAGLRAQGFTAVEADLDQGFPPATALGTSGSTARPLVDLAWAASSLHHLGDPRALLDGAREALAPDGTLLVIEMAGLPRFLTGPDAALEERCHDAAARAGWNRHPDWTPIIAAAGFTVRRHEITTRAPASAAAREYAHQGFSRLLALVELDAGDRAAVEALLPHLAHDTALDPRAGRTVWVATPTATT